MLICQSSATLPTRKRNASSNQKKDINFCFPLETNYLRQTFFTLIQFVKSSLRYFKSWVGFFFLRIERKLSQDLVKVLKAVL